MPYLYYHGSMDRLPLLNKNVSHLKILYVSPFIAHTIHTFVMLLLVLLLLLLLLLLTLIFLILIGLFLRAHFIMIFAVRGCVCVCGSRYIRHNCVNLEERESEREEPLPISILWITICIYHLIACTPSSSSLFIHSSSFSALCANEV